MKYLIRFEDMYGLADIFCKAYDMEYVCNKLTVTHVSGALDLKVGIGASSAVGISKHELEFISRSGYNKVITVFDMDSLGVNKNAPLSSDEFRKRLPSGLNEAVFKWIPVRWESETMMLLPNINNSVKLVNERTWEYHVVLLAILHALTPANKAKVFRNYILDSDITAIKQLADKPVRELLTDYATCGYTVEETCSILDKYCVDFYKYLDSVIYFNICGVRLSNHDSLYVNKSRFKNFPNTFK